MAETGSKLGRRNFMRVSSAAVAAPLLLGGAKPMAAATPSQAKTTTASALQGPIYFIGKGCVGCHTCLAFCPAEAVHFGDTGNEIDQAKCAHCGTCFEGCPLSMISKTEI